MEEEKLEGTGRESEPARDRMPACKRASPHETQSQRARDRGPERQKLKGPERERSEFFFFLVKERDLN